MTESSGSALSSSQDPSSQDPSSAEVTDAELVDVQPAGALVVADDEASTADDIADADLVTDDPPERPAAPATAPSWAGPAASTSLGPAFGDSGSLGFDYTDAGVPTLDYVRSKVEGRLGTAQGATELAESTTAARDAAEREAKRAQAAQDKLEEIRRSLRDGS